MMVSINKRWRAEVEHRIRAAGILIKQDAMLLLRIQDETGEYWVPPGGGFEAEDVSTKGCLRREFLEEAGVEASVGELICVREFLESGTNRYNVEFYYQVIDCQGTPHLDNLKGLNDESVIKAVEWIPLDQLSKIRSYPTDLKQLADKVGADAFSLHLGSYIQGHDESINHLV